MNNRTEEIWKKFGSRLMSFIRSKIRDEDEAKDIFQEVFLKIHTKIDMLNDETKIQSWLFQITRNQIIDYYRSHKANDNRVKLLSDLSEEEPDDFMLEAVEDMIGMMDALPAEYCEALCSTEIAGMSQKAYAKKTGITYSCAKSRVQRARKMLKDMLMRCCHYQFDVYGTVIGIYPANCCCCKNKSYQ